MTALHHILQEWDWRVAMGLADLVQGRDKWWAFVKMEIHLCVSKI
jgi:hypothetical protein